MDIGNYQIISPIAHGAFGRVYLARHRVLSNRQVALKLMHAVPFSSMQEHEQFLQEARLLEQLKHSYILPVLDVGVHEDVPYIVSEYAPGNSLRQRLLHRNTQPLSFDETQTILSQVGQALEYVHEQNIIHRDVKPENILFNSKGEALLADFGIATTLTAASMKSTTSAGTPRYMSPEQFKGKASKKSDQYSLACIAYELFTGHPPFDASDPIALMYQHIHTLPTPLSDHNPQLAPEIQHAVLKALSKQRDERYASVREFLDALQSTETTFLANATPASPPIASLPSPEALIGTASFSTDPIAAGNATGEIDPATTILLTPDNSASSNITHPTLKHDQDKTAPTVSIPNQEAVHPQFPKNYHLKPTRLLIAVVSALLLAVTIAGSLFWALHSSASANGGARSSLPLLPHNTPTSSSSQHSPLVSTPTSLAKNALPTSSPTPSTKTQPISLSASPSASTPGQPTSTIPSPAPTSTPVPQPTPTPIPIIAPTPTPTSSSFSYYVCGDQVHLVNIPAWHTVQAGTLVNDPAYTGPVNSYTGPSGNPNSSPGNCSGRYQWAWDNSQVEADWTWANASLPNGHCQVVIHIPSWYAGAPDARYTLTVASDTTSINYTFDKQNQNQPSTTWISLLINGQIPSLAMPTSTNNTYTLTLSLFNGGTANWYLGADAIRFDCTA